MPWASSASPCPDIVNALQKQNTVNPAGQIGAEPVPPGQEFTYTVRAQGRLVSPEQFGAIVLRANADGSIVRLKDVARIELGAQVYNVKGRIDGEPAGLMGIYQTPGTNALATVQGVRQVMEAGEETLSRRPRLHGLPRHDAVRSRRASGISSSPCSEALGLVILVVFLFLQGWRATLIPALAVPVSLIGTFAVFPLLGFSINTLSLFGLVLAIGLVVDDAIIVVEAVERHIEEGLSPKDASLKAMEEVSGPVMAIALILAAVFIPTVFIPGITGQALPAVRGHHRHLGHHLGLQRPDPEPRPLRPPAQAAGRPTGPSAPSSRGSTACSTGPPRAT